MEQEVSFTANKVMHILQKPAVDFTKNDIMRLIEQNNVRMLNFRYVAGDGRLKSLNFVINDKRHLEKILSMGERVDGSSLFPFVSAESSDLYVIPRFKTVFFNPFSAVPTIDLLCNFYDNKGNPLESAPEYIIQKAQDSLRRSTGLTMEALGELEYYLFSAVDPIYKITEQKGYHESYPFSKWDIIRLEAMKFMSEIGITIKYGHAEVGNIIRDDKEMVQQEIELLPTPIEDAADQLVIAKWVLRGVAYRHGIEATFAPKLIRGQAGSGLHIHTRFTSGGKNVVADEQGLTSVAKRAIAGYLLSAESLTAFGNNVPTSFLRLVPHQEAPTSICWGDRNRSVLVRVPLGWLGTDNRMLMHANPNELETDYLYHYENNQTIELRSPDGSANVYLLLASMAVAARYGLTHNDALNIADNLYIKADASKIKELKQLPASCYESADCLARDRQRYEDDNVFPAGLIDAQIKKLRDFNDLGLSSKVINDEALLKTYVERFLHCG